MTLLLGCWATHVVLSEWIASPWWVPNVTLVGLIVAVGRTPKRWWLFSTVAGVATLLWTVRDTRSLAITYVLIGGALALLAERIDTFDERIFLLVVAAASTVFTLVLLWFDELRSWSILGLALIQIGITVLAALMIRPMTRSALTRSPQ